MAPQEAKIFLVDDDEYFREYLARVLREVGHTISAEAGSLQMALEKLEKMQNDDVDVALLDGTLSPYSERGSDGAKIAKAFREKFPGKPLFSISSDRQSWSDDPDLTLWSGEKEIARRVTEA